jgi:multiple sugar transport system ATP-binding protein
MTLGDRVAVMRAGILQQVGSPKELYDNPLNIFVAGFIGSPAMNFMPAQIEGGSVKLPMVEVPLPDRLRRAAEGGGTSNVIAGIRPENFEDAAIVGDARSRGVTFRTKIDLLESMGSELYAYFAISTEGIQSEELAELAADAGTADVPGGGSEQVVSRLSAESQVQQGQEAELWLDPEKLHLFDPASGKALTST